MFVVVLEESDKYNNAKNLTRTFLLLVLWAKTWLMNALTTLRQELMQLKLFILLLFGAKVAALLIPLFRIHIFSVTDSSLHWKVGKAPCPVKNWFISFAVKCIFLLQANSMKWLEMKHVWGASWCIIGGPLQGPFSVKLTTLTTQRTLSARDVIPRNWSPKATYTSRLNFLWSKKEGTPSMAEEE